MKKRLFALLLAMSMLCTLFVVPASAAELTDGEINTAVYLGVENYGTIGKSEKENFMHRFNVAGEEIKGKITNDGHYTLQNRLQEGYVYDLKVEGGVITDVVAATATAAGKITAVNEGKITVNGSEYTVTKVYEIENAQAGSTAVTVKALSDLAADKTVKVYGDVAYLTFVAEEYTAPSLAATAGEKTLFNYLKTAMTPVGTALYVYGGGWDWQDDVSSNQALTIGLPQSWVDFFQQQDINYSYKTSEDKAHSYYPHNSWNQYYYAGVDCSAYIGWTIYNVMNTESTTNDQTDGYVMGSTKMAKTFADYGWGTWTRDIKANEFKPGDIFSMSGHVWTVVGVCDDGSIVFLHSTPSDNRDGSGSGGGGVQLSALNPNDDNDKDCEAYKLVTKYMAKYYPEWNERYEPVLRKYSSYAAPASNKNSGKFSWTLGEGGVLTDPDGIVNMSADEVLAKLFGEPIPTKVNDVVYLGVKDYGTVNADDKADFIHKFAVNGTVVEYTIESDDSYTLQNRLQEGYVYNLKVQGDVIVDLDMAKADAEGKITAVNNGTITVDGKDCTVTTVYEIKNNEAGSTAVTVKALTDLAADKTVKVYGDVAYLTFVAEEYTAPVSGTPGLKTLKNWIATAMNPVGTSLYVYGGGWDWQDVNSSNQALTIGLPQSWVDFFQMQDINYSYKNSDDHAHSYYPHESWNQYYSSGVDCSAYVGWVAYNVMNTESTTNDQSNGYVMSAVKMARTFADTYGWGTWTREFDEFKPGDVFSMSGHVWTVVGVCDDGSIVFLHSTPSDNRAGTGSGGGGVQLSALNPNDDNNKDCEAYRLVSYYMAKYYPEWNERYEPVLRSYESYATPATGSTYRETWSGKFSWNLTDGVLTDPNGYANMSAAEILADLFGEVDAEYENAVYLGVDGYGTVDSDDKANFVHRFYVDGKEVEYTMANDGRYTLQNLLQEGYVYNVTVEQGVITGLTAAEATVEGKITSVNENKITVNGKDCTVATVYEIKNDEAGSTAVTVKTLADLAADKTVKVYGDVAFLAFVAEEYTAPVSGTPGLKTLRNWIETAMTPVGTSLYVYGGGWDWQDVNSSNQALTIGLPQSWVDFFQMQDINYSYKTSSDPAHSYYPHNSWNQYYYAGVDCSAYVGWVAYNVMNKESDVNTNTDGYVMSAVKMARTFADTNGWGTWTRDFDEFKPGDVFSMSGHVWTVVGVCDDGSIVFLHSTPSDNRAGTGSGGGGVQLSALNPNDDDNKDCQAYELVTKYMAQYYPEWNERYEPVLRSYESYATPASGTTYRETWSGKFSWNLGEGGVLTDPDGIADMSADEILALIFGEYNVIPSNPSKPVTPTDPTPTTPAEPEPEKNSFVDVNSGDWFFDAVNWAVESKITTGTDDTHFSPDLDCSRAQLVTFLWRAAGSPVVDYTMSFADVNENEWYGEAVRWAASTGIVKGYDNGLFGTDDIITREQAVTMLYRFAAAQGIDVSVGEDTNILSYTDALSISDYAFEAMQWACGAGVVQGYNGELMPAASCNRAQIVTMLYRIYQD